MPPLGSFAYGEALARTQPRWPGFDVAAGLTPRVQPGPGIPHHRSGIRTNAVDWVVSPLGGHEGVTGCSPNRGEPIRTLGP
jgi:hypothetical protein